VRIRFVNLLLAALLVLAAVRLWTALRAPLPQLPPPPAAESPGGMEAAAAAPPAESPAGAGAEGYDAIVARDLFSAARGVIPPAPPPAAKPAPKPAAQPKLTLSGVVIVDGEKSAYLLEGTQEARPRKVREGEAFAGGTVKLIRPDGITFLFGGSEITVPLRTPKDAGGAARPAEVAATPVRPDALPRRAGQPAPPPGTAGQVRRPPQAIPGMPRLMPAPEEEPILDEEDLVDEEEMGDEEELLDDSEIPPEDFEEPIQ
jgi:hypothetical protein